MRNFPQYLLNGSIYFKEILQVNFSITQDCFACFKIFFCLHTLPWQLFFQLVNELRNEHSHLDSMISANLVERTYTFKSEINQKHVLWCHYDVNLAFLVITA